MSHLSHDSPIRRWMNSWNSTLRGGATTSSWFLHRWIGSHPCRLWFVNLATLMSLMIWMLLDPRFDAVVTRLRFESGLHGDPRQVMEIGDWSALGSRKIVLISIGITASLTGLMMLVGTLVGSRKHRELKSWLILITLVCLWLGAFHGWRSVTWLGKQNRLRFHVADFESIAHNLQADWPSQDGERARIGPFMAYPVGHPATLLCLTLPELSRSGTSFSVVERDGRGSLRFQLVGSEQGDWLEWHPHGDLPSSFVGGLLDYYEMQRFQELGRSWFLVRYRS